MRIAKRRAGTAIIIAGSIGWALASCNGGPSSVGGPDAASDVGVSLAPPPSIGPDAATDDGGLVEPTGGTRLAARWYETADGMRAFDTFVDTKLGIACSLPNETDTRFRCLPTPPLLPTYWYADAACNVPVTVVPKSCAAGARWLWTPYSPTDPTCPATGVYAPASAATALTLYASTASGCVATAVDPAFDYVYPSSGSTPLPSTDFVAFDARPLVPVAPGIAMRTMVAEDGARSWLFPLVDVARGRACGPLLAADGVLRCLPWTRSNYGDVWTDDKCTMSGTLINDYDCSFARLLSDPDTLIQTEAPCDTSSHVWTLGATVPNTWVQIPSPDGGAPECLPLLPQPNTKARAPGVELAASTFPAIVTTKVPAAARLSVASLVTPHATVGTARIRDDLLDVDCTFAATSDGKYRCVPTEVRIVTPHVYGYFRDAQCTMPAALVDSTSQSGSCAARPPLRFVTQLVPGASCDLVAHVYAAGAPLASTDPLWLLQPTGCVPSSLPAGATAIALGAELAPDMFMEAQRVSH
jgi:hypothetical protein